MKNDPKLVSFERSAAYMHHRAMMNRQANRNVDALELLRKAVETSPDNNEYRLDLAELYCNMGCHEQSVRLLLDMLAGDDAPSECYYGLARNQLGMNDAFGARKSLEIYSRSAPEDADLEEVTSLMGELDQYLRGERPAGGRRLWRALRMADRACEALKNSEAARACRLFERSLKLASEQYEMRALYAMALAVAERRDEAREQAEQAAGAFPPSVRALCVGAQVFNMLGDGDRAVKLLDAAANEKPQGPELRLLIFTAGELGTPDRAAEYARLALQETPYDRQLWHIRGVALKKSGATDEEAGRCWTHITRVNPEDSVALYYAEAAARGELDADKLDYNYQVPDDELLRRVKLLTDTMEAGYDRINEQWEENPEFRRLLYWAVGSDDKRLSDAALTTMCTLLDDPEDLSLLRVLMVRPDIRHELKLHAVVLTRLQGVPMNQIMPATEESISTTLVNIDALVADLPVSERQMLRYADEVLSREYDVQAFSGLVMLWVSYRKVDNLSGDPMKRTPSAAAALVYHFLLQHDMAPDIGKLSRQFGCNVRQLAYCAKRMAYCFDKLNNMGMNP